MKKDNNCDKKFEEVKEKNQELKEENKELKEELKECKVEKEEKINEVEELRKKAEEYYDQLLRLKAEFENYRKRIEKERPELINWGKYELMQGILPLYEMLNMAKKHLETSNSYENVKMGLEMIFSEFKKFFLSNGLEEINLLNKKYDPNLCEIVGTVDGNEENDGMVVEILQPGYLVNGRLLKPARVKIARKKSSEDKTSENKNEVSISNEEEKSNN